MKVRKIIIIALVCLLVIALASGCRKKVTQESAGSLTAVNAAAQETTTQQSAQTQSEAADQSAETEKEKEEQTTEEASDKPDDSLMYYTLADLDDLKHTDNFSKSAIEHIFNGSVNSSNKGSGYHYDMITDSDGKIIEGTRSEEDINGLYTAYVEVVGHKKDHYSTFFPDAWSPQDVVDAINIARDDALDNNRHKGEKWIGYYEDIEINMYFDSKDRVVSAFPIYEDDK